MNRKSIYWGFILTVLLSSLIFILGLDRKDYIDTPSTVYQVYLNGEQIGIIKDEKKLYDLIDKEQENLKKEYKVKKIYAPLGLETTKLVTYTGEVDSIEDVYNKIKNVEPFTLKGYEVTITHSKDKIEKLNILNKEDLEIAVDNTIKAFVDEEKFEKYMNSKQDKIITTGETIEDISIKENITLKEKYLSTEDKIYTNSTDLSKYFLFGSDDSGGTHIVVGGDTIKSIAAKYQLNERELLIVNPNLTSVQTLLFPGQELNIGLVNPIISVIEDKTLVEDKEVQYGIEEKYDDRYVIGTTKTERAGENGISRMTYKVQTINGSITSLEPTNTEVLKPVVNEVVIKGGLPLSGPSSLWYWPTNRPYVVTEYFGWRFDPIDGTREFHNGIDISGTGFGSPIYAANSGYITEIGTQWSYGNYIKMSHGDDFQTIYMHLNGFKEGLTQGSFVEGGELIGYMGTSGWSTGTHLDFRIIYRGEYIDPLGYNVQYR